MSHINTLRGTLDDMIAIHGVYKSLRDHAQDNTIAIKHVGERDIEYCVLSSGEAA